MTSYTVDRRKPTTAVQIVVDSGDFPEGVTFVRDFPSIRWKCSYCGANRLNHVEGLVGGIPTLLCDGSWIITEDGRTYAMTNAEFQERFDIVDERQ